MSEAQRSGCPINLTLEALGDRWSLIVIRDIMFGNKRHFRELLAGSQEGIASNILASRLKSLVESGLLSKADEPGHKQKVRYSLTDAAGKPVPLHGVKVLFRHPAYEKEDKSVTLALATGQEFAVQHMPKDGVWIVEVDADAGLAEPYREVRRIMISHGALQ